MGEDIPKSTANIYPCPLFLSKISNLFYFLPVLLCSLWRKTAFKDLIFLHQVFKTVTPPNNVLKSYSNPWLKNTQNFWGQNVIYLQRKEFFLFEKNQNRIVTNKTKWSCLKEHQEKPDSYSNTLLLLIIYLPISFFLLLVISLLIKNNYTDI